MVEVGVVALDGTKIAANASMFANHGEDTLRKMAAEAAAVIMAEAKAVDAAEDHYDDGGDDTPESMRAARRRETIRLFGLDRRRTGG